MSAGQILYEICCIQLMQGDEVERSVKRDWHGLSDASHKRWEIIAHRFREAVKDKGI